MQPGKEKKPYLLSSVNNALKILDLLSVRDNIGVAEISRLLKLDKASVFKMLYTLEHRDYVIKTADAKYRLGIKFTNYGNLVAERQTVADVAAPYLARLQAATGETVCLSTLNTNGRVIVTHLIEGSEPGHIAARVGYEMDAHSNANGKLLLANLSSEMQASILKKLALVPHTPYTITDRAAFQSQLDVLRDQLIVEQQQEDILGHSDMAAPVFDHLGACCCAVSIVCSTARMDEFQGTYRRLLLRTAEDISKKMGYYGAWNWFPNGP